MGHDAVSALPLLNSRTLRTETSVTFSSLFQMEFVLDHSQDATMTTETRLALTFSSMSDFEMATVIGEIVSPR